MLHTSAHTNIQNDFLSEQNSGETKMESDLPFTSKSVKTDIIEGTEALIFKHFRHIMTLNKQTNKTNKKQKNQEFIFFYENCTVLRANTWVHSVKF